MDEMIRDAIKKGLISIVKSPKEGDTLLKNLRLMEYIGRNFRYEQDEYLMTHLDDWVQGCRN